MSGPDSGLALAIMLAMACMVAGPGLVGGALGFFVARGTARRSGRDSKSGAMTGALTLGGLVVGSGLGAIAIVFTFFENTFDPVLVFDVPPGFARDEIYVLEDPTASRVIEVGTFSREAHVAVPASGVVRVNSLGDFSGGPLNARLSTGATSMGASASPGPGGAYTLCFTFTAWTPGDESCERSGPELVAHIAEIEND